jgi:hypothetical protein
MQRRWPHLHGAQVQEQFDAVFIANGAGLAKT